MAAGLGQRKEEQRDEQVKLFLDRQRPGVEQRFLGGGGIEVTGLAPEVDVGITKGGGDDRFAQREEVGRQQQAVTRDHGAGGCHKQGGEDAADAAFPEGPKGEGALGQFAQQDAGDQVAGDDEENIDANVAAREPQAGVVEHHQHHREGAEAVYVGAIGGPSVTAQCQNSGQHRGKLPWRFSQNDLGGQKQGRYGFDRMAACLFCQSCWFAAGKPQVLVGCLYIPP